ncbi:4Fe-4S dicluster domain-containing protein [Bacteroidota bacterium]
MSFKAKHIRYFFFVLAIILAMPLPFPELSGGLIWTSPFILLNSVLSVKRLVFLNLPGLITLILIFWRTRWICRYVCPLGVVCDWSSKIRKQKTIMINLHKYLAVLSLVLAVFGAPLLIILDPFNIFHMSFESVRTGLNFPAILKFSMILAIVGINILLPGIWCQSICPLGGMQLLAIDLKNTFQKKTSYKKSITVNRRLFISGLAGIAGGIALPRLTFFSHGKTIRPPSALPDSDFNLICARCGNCSSVCPTHIIKQSDNTSKIGSLLTPIVDFTESYCLPECTVCGDVCPSGAITKFKEGEKNDLFMASVKINLDDCWLNHQKDCDLCRYHCKYDAIEIKKTEENLIAFPVLYEDKCVGCAACKIVCPAGAIEILVN